MGGERPSMAIKALRRAEAPNGKNKTWRTSSSKENRLNGLAMFALEGLCIKRLPTSHWFDLGSSESEI